MICNTKYLKTIAKEQQNCLKVFLLIINCPVGLLVKDFKARAKSTVTESWINNSLFVWFNLIIWTHCLNN